MFCDTKATFRKSELTKNARFLENKWIHFKASFKKILVCKVDFVLNVFKNSQKTLLASATASLL